MKRRSLADCKLYCIVDRAVLGDRDPVKVAEAAIRGGADLIQWRDKDAGDREFLKAARALRALMERMSVPFVVNDRVDVAMRVKADGVHLGHEDLPVEEARALVGPSMLIGRSTHSLEEALRAQQAGCDYLGVGPVFSTPTKPEYREVGVGLLAQVQSAIRIPWFAIGGIDLSRIALVLSAGARRIAVVRAVAGASDPEGAARALKKELWGHNKSIVSPEGAG